MEFHRASLTYFSIAALCLLKPLFVLGESELHSFPSPNRLQSLGQLCQEGVTAQGFTQLGDFPEHSGTRLTQWPSTERPPAHEGTWGRAVWGPTQFCAAPEQEEQELFMLNHGV